MLHRLGLFGRGGSIFIFTLSGGWEKVATGAGGGYWTFAGIF